MNKLIKEIKELEKTKINKKIKERIKEFKSFENKDNEEWFSELCFCLLTSNSKAQTALNIQQELGAKGFLKDSSEKICATIIKNKHRFHNTKTRFIMDARKHAAIKEIIQNIVKDKNVREAREWLVSNVKGLGYKEASHFLRNVGYLDLAILDRHIVNVMLDHKIINNKPKSLGRKNYLEIEKKFMKISDKAGMPAGELDFYMWYMKAGDVLK